MPDSDERYLRNAIRIMLSLALFASGFATLIHWLSPVRQPMDLIVPPLMCVFFTGLLVALTYRPQWISGIVRLALLVSALALAAPSWFYTLQADRVAGEQLIRVFPPVSSLFVVLMVMVMVFIPGRKAIRAAVIGWILIALPVLVYLFAHPGELWTPRGKDLLMTYGPVIVMVIVLLPIQRGQAGKIRQLAWERSRMAVMLRRDPLTRIYNRRLSEQVLQDFVSERVPGGVILFDMDRFKSINDTHGHMVGDRVLQWVARCCKGHLRHGECFSRWGGEEFLVIVPDVDVSRLQQVAERLRSAIEDSPVKPVGQVTASFGATMIRDGDHVTGLLHRVDQALYEAKQRGRNCVVHV